MKDLRSGTMAPRPPMRIAMEEILAKPHRAKVTERKSFIARYGMRAILAGVLANLMSASLAGLFLAL